MMNASPIPRRRAPARGFTLIELAVVIAIIGLLLGAVLTPLATQLEVRKNRETERALRDIRQALIGFAITNRRLPCPDNPANGPDGGEDCTVDEGYLPWVALGVAPADAWGHLFRYRVTDEFTQTAIAGAACAGGNGRLDLCDVGDIRLFTRGEDPGTAGTQTKAEIDLTTTAPAVVLSHGANGAGAVDVSGYAGPAVAAGTDEAENADGDAVFVARLHTAGGADCDDADEAKSFCAFDDLAVWLSRSVLATELLNAGVLP